MAKWSNTEDLINSDDSDKIFINRGDKTNVLQIFLFFKKFIKLGEK